ncbi:hypothetical protein HCN44_008516 [Aphidius gifuensis]|uniref:Uncharacterized protein n=1 Tax=Aphidius gifuensis TaxID=684658 RepID=A0A834XQK5_APHGI|nr:neuromodulin [Aphidius gifuensis]KAF7989842.1 hypothetical protein HCN44_008516 [Aphidius gifuensis]
MGCNTSKESVQPAEDEAKEDMKNSDIPKSADSNAVKTESNELSEEKENNKIEEKEEENITEKESEEPSDKEVEAATRIQAVFRGHHARKSMKDTGASSKGTNTEEEREPTREELQEEFRADDVELCNAATKIQASFRGHMSRKEQGGASVVKGVDDAIDTIEEKVDDAVNELEGIDLTDPDLHKAATKIQASFRGHKVRQEVVPEVKK